MARPSCARETVMLAVAFGALTGAAPSSDPRAPVSERTPGCPARRATPCATTLSLATWVVPPILASGTRLPAPAGHRVTWRANGRPLPDGVLRNAGARDRLVSVDGVVHRPDGSRLAKRFTVRLLGAGARRLAVYARAPTSAREANQPTAARSVHLALSDGDGRWHPLNDDYGVAFARGDVIGMDRVALRGVADPSLFHFADGAIGVIATRVDMEGRPQPRPGQAIVFRSDPGSRVDFVELGTLDLGTTGGIRKPRALWDRASRRYLISWRDAAARPHWTTLADLTRTKGLAIDTGAEGQEIVTAGNMGPVRPGAVTTGDTDAIAIGAATATALANRFGRIVNTAATVAPQTILAGQTNRLNTVRADLRYSDGSAATRAVDWDAADLARLTRPGRYPVRGTIRQRPYPAIFAYNRADPAIYRWEHDGRTRYLFVATDDTDNDNVASPHLPLRVADTIAGLADENGGRTREIDLLNRRTRRDRTAEGRVIAGCYWAPEIHEIGGRLSILFAPCFNPEDDRSSEGGVWSQVESHIMQLRDGGDPAVPADWSPPAAIRKADGGRLGRAGMPANISLDMSYMLVRGQGYYIWSQRYLPASGPIGDPVTWIARVDPARPTRLAGAPSPIIAPQTSVEENLAEGAFALQHAGRLTLVYSSSGVSPTYVVNGASASLDADITRMESWQKWSAPLQKSMPMPPGAEDYRRYEQGPGHGAFTTDEDGNALYVYHTWGNGVGGDGRDARVRRIHWAADGRPLLDMSRDDEVAPQNRRVTMEVTVR